MKRLAALIVTALFSLSVYAGSTGSTEMGPFVDCHLPDGKMDYIPSMMCKNAGGVVK
ncbi:hypothetical protein VIOR3934_18550 [Vibrio orientalis CIP 102891 = ATCC 33934]|uniref:Secreted protein n=1 Tax=Vibrio orientalis CIP 102891 = ATCC 33934 TaxID=675816 RepID=C9QM13_VIBOR|nr:hypothetical protein [Vibrio orientalis]EEX93030.1 hypothetical protein VIA_003677 [Vibrio orientalis CIP 102891 = ATCC 33934]EGU50649.1 hypothetical protein VIOR3934_18550 [Vibrio orientalis CIP 102891 = ATCC 33934]